MRLRAMMLTVVLSVSAVLLALFVPTTATAAPGSPPPDPEHLCEHLHEVPAEEPLCTHGPDRTRSFGPAAELTEPPAAATPTDLAAMCHEGGTSGRRIEVLYAVPSDRTNRFATMLPTMRNVLAQVDGNLAEQPGGGGQHYRWLCENGTDVTIRNVTLLPVGTDSLYDWWDYYDSVTDQVALGLGPVDFLRSDRIYFAFIDQILDVYPYGGQGTVLNDASPDPATNWNNTSTQYSMSAYFDAEVAAHEIGHNLGAVQMSAPHSSGGWHCYDELDVMCYSDGGSYFTTGGGALTYPCVAFSVDYLVDCGQDDYYFPGDAPPGNYLDDHWNIADSGFLTPWAPGVSTTSPRDGATTAPVAGTVTATFNEDVQGVDGTTFTLDQAGTPVAATVSYDSGTRTATLDPTSDLTPTVSYTATLTGGAAEIRDLTGNPLTSKTWTFTADPGPAIIKRSPVVNDARIAQTANVGVQFGEPVAGISTATFTLWSSTGAQVGASVRYDAAKRIATLDPTRTLLPDHRYTATLTGGPSAIRDGSGNPLVNSSWSFLTGPAPVLTSGTPGNRATGVSRLTNVVAYFSEPVTGVTTSSFTLRNAATGAVYPAVVSRSSMGSRAWILDPTVTLPANSTFTVSVVGMSTRIRDAAGNPLITNGWRFSTGSR